MARFGLGRRDEEEIVADDVVPGPRPLLPCPAPDCREQQDGATASIFLTLLLPAGPLT